MAYLGNEDWIDELGEFVEEDDLYGDIFNGCDLLTDVKVDAANEVYADIDGILITKDKKTLLYCPTAKRDVVIPEGVEEIRNDCFFGCQLTSTSLPSTLLYIGESAFENSALTSIVIGTQQSSASNSYAPKQTSSSQQSITIGAYAFGQCDDLKTVVLGSNISEIGSSAFSSFTSLTDVYTYSITPQAIDLWTFGNVFPYDGNPSCKATLHVLPGCKASYETAEGWSSFNEIIEDAQITGIRTTTSNTTASDDEGCYYDLMGRKTNSQVPGIYIKNGKKIIVK